MDISQFGIWNVLHQSQLAPLQAALQGAGIHTFTLDGAPVHDTASFFAQAAKDLPLPAEHAERHDWDAFGDSLRSPISLADSDTLALVWHDAHRLAGSDIATLLQAFDVLLSLSRSLYSPASGAPGKTLYLFLLGQGPGFAPASKL